MNVQEFLPYLAGALQWARARKSFPEIWYALIVVVASFGFYVLAHPDQPFAVSPAVLLAGWWDQAKTILAMTQLVSTGSNIASAASGDTKPHALLPVTDSQK